MDKERIRSFLKFVIGFLLILIITMVAYWAWVNFFSPNVRKVKELQKSGEAYIKVIENYKTAMKADIFGGKTPQETLNLFITALEKEDAELAVKYFVLQEDGKVNEQVRQALIDRQKEGSFKEMARLLKLAKPETEGVIGDFDYRFSVYESGKQQAYIIMGLNKYSNVWKIESM